MKPKVYNILSEAIDQGIKLGLNRAQKKELIGVDANSAVLNECLHSAIMVCICDYFDFE